MRRVWPDTFVEESSLMRNISVLRKALGDEDGRYIETLPKHGYRFIAPVEEVPVSGAAAVVEEPVAARASGRRLWIGTAAVILLATAAAVVAYVIARPGPPPAIRSLAVLPLKDLAAGGPERKHLELGIADSIITRVSEISGLTVRPVGAVRKYAEAGADPLRAGRELKVDVVLDGSLQVAGNRIRASVNLIETSRGVSLWAQAFDVPFSDLFDVEDEVARQVARQLRLRLEGGWQSRLARHSTRNPEAYEHYLKGLYSAETPRLSRAGRAAIEEAISRFRKATELDPSYAQAWAQLASSYYQLVNFYQPDEALAERAKNAADRAYALDPDLPELLVFRAQVFWSWNGHYRIEEAIRELRRAPGKNSSAVHSLLGVLYHNAGLDAQAIAELQRAIAMDPTNSLHLDRLGAAYVWAGRFDEARSAYARALAVGSEAKGRLVYSALPFLYAHQFDEARRRLENARVPDSPNRVESAYLGLLDAMEGRFRQAENAIPADSSELERFRDAHSACYAYASICALQGKSGAAVRWLRKTVGTGMPNYPLFSRDPNLAPIRGSAEYAQLMAELKPRFEAMQREFR
jgi:TolB-like protein/Flp pilus assembly protein TadD